MQVVLQGFHAKILAGNLTAALVISGHRYLVKNPSKKRDSRADKPGPSLCQNEAIPGKTLEANWGADIALLI
jgi:hypothetical protein